METEAKVPSSIIKKSREDLRNSIFAPAHTKPSRIPIQYGGEQLELVTPTIAELTLLQGREGRNFVIDTIITFARIPGTDEAVFDESDYDTMVNSPISSDFNNCVAKVTQLLQVTVDDKVKN